MRATLCAGVVTFGVLFACTNSPSPGRHGGGVGGDDGSSAGTATSAAGGTAEGGAAGAAGELSFLSGPSFTGSTNPATAQVGILSYETSSPVTGRARVRGGGESWQLQLSEPRANVEKTVLGLKPDTDYTLDLTLEDDRGHELRSSPLTWTTPGLPEGFPLFDVVISEPDSMEPGMTLFNARGPVADFLVIVDNEGTVRWYDFDLEHRVQEDHRRLDNGNFIYLREFRVLAEVDVLGNQVACYNAQNFPQPYEPPQGCIPVDVDTFHHEASQLDNGNFLVLSSSARTIEDFPTSETDANAPTEKALVVGPVIVEFTPSGEVIKRIALMDLLDPLRIGRDSLGGHWSVYGLQARDWGHGNALIYDDYDDSYYVSLRNQDAVVKVKRSSETLTWIFGPPINWKEPWASKLLSPVGDLTWPFHQHAVELNADGLGLYDNGNYRAGAYQTATDTEYSRVAVYAPDEAKLTVSQVWDYGAAEGDDSFFSALMGDADWQPLTGNVLITNAVLYTEKFGGSAYGELLEVTPEGRRVFQLDVGDPSSSGNAIHAIYRAQRLEDIRR